MRESNAPNLSEATASFFEHLGEIRKWQEEQVHKLRSMQQAQWAQMQQEQKRIDILLKRENVSASQQDFQIFEQVSSATSQSVPQQAKDTNDKRCLESVAYKNDVEVLEQIRHKKPSETEPQAEEAKGTSSEKRVQYIAFKNGDKVGEQTQGKKPFETKLQLQGANVASNEKFLQSVASENDVEVTDGTQCKKSPVTKSLVLQQQLKDSDNKKSAEPVVSKYDFGVADPVKLKNYPFTKLQAAQNNEKGLNISETVVKGSGGVAFHIPLEKPMSSYQSQKNAETDQKKPVKKNFLRKGEGLKRYQLHKIYAPGKNQSEKGSKPASQTSSCERKISRLPNVEARSKKPPIKTIPDKRKKNRSVTFKDPVVVKEPRISRSSSALVPLKDSFQNARQKDFTENFANMKLKESKELAEFEILEHVAENSSFSSDSSIIERIFNDESQKVDSHVESVQRSVDSIPKSTVTVPKSTVTVPKSTVTGPKSTDTIPKSIDIIPKPTDSLEINAMSSKCKIESFPLHAENVSHDEMPEFIASLRAHLRRIEQELSSDSVLSCPSSPDVSNNHQEFGNDPYEDYSLKTSTINSSLYEDGDLSMVAVNETDSILDAAGDQKLHGYDKGEENVEREDMNEWQEETKSDSSHPKAKLMEKTKELEEEIELYKNYNKQLAALMKLKEEEVNTLRKNREDFDKFAESEKIRIEEEIATKRSQMKREKDTFKRYQRLRGDFPGRKERAESALLRQQISNLQDELKKLTSRSISESKRLRKLLDAALKERDILKFENKRLENQRKDLFSALEACTSEDCLCKHTRKAYLKQFSSYFEDEDAHELDNDEKIKEICEDIVCISDEEPADAQNPVSEEKEKTLNDYELQDIPEKDEPVKKSRVRFNLEPEIQNYTLDESSAQYKEIQHEDKVERIYDTGEVEVIFKSGTRQYASADGLHMVSKFYNGDSKEIFPDKRVVYTAADGRKETTYPNGVIEFEFPGLQSEQHFPDGMRKVLYNNGVCNIFFPNGAEETIFPNGIKAKSLPDGTEVIEYPQGDKEIRSSEYLKREYTDGSVKTVFNSGRTETYYSNGRVKIRDIQGRVIINTNLAHS